MASILAKQALLLPGFAKKRAKPSKPAGGDERSNTRDAIAREDLAWLSLSVSDPVAAEAADRDLSWLALLAVGPTQEAQPFPGDRLM
jgi:hypothetical protein